MLIKLLILSFFIVLISIAALGVRILLKKQGRFPETHISRNAEMRKRGIRCAQHNDLGCRPDEELSCCATCNNIKQQEYTFQIINNKD